jgi:hypothetical protein
MVKIFKIVIGSQVFAGVKTRIFMAKNARNYGPGTVEIRVIFNQFRISVLSTLNMLFLACSFVFYPILA